MQKMKSLPSRLCLFRPYVEHWPLGMEGLPQDTCYIEGFDRTCEGGDSEATMHCTFHQLVLHTFENQE